MRKGGHHHGRQKQHMTYVDLKNARKRAKGRFKAQLDFPPEYEGMFKFALVRNPWSRLFSIFTHIYQRDDGLDFSTWARWQCQLVKNNYPKNDKDYQSKFWLNNLDKTHIAPMYRYKDNVPDLVVYKFEDLLSSWDAITTRIGLENTPLKRTRKNGYRRMKKKFPEHYSYYYNDEDVEWVKKCYHMDIETFEYEYLN